MDRPERVSAGWRALRLALGVAAVLVGLALLANPVAGAESLAWLIALALTVAGVSEIVAARQQPHPWTGVLLGASLVVGAVVAVSWPGITLWALAVVVGVDLVLHGSVRAGLAIADRRALPDWWLFAAVGVVNVVVGVLALVWPAATVLVLALLLGAQVTVFGLLMTLSAFRTSATVVADGTAAGGG